MQYHHESARWGQSPPHVGTTSTTPTHPTDTENNNNQPLGKHQISNSHSKTNTSPQEQNSIAAADSSSNDNHNNPPTPQPINSDSAITPQNFPGNNSTFGIPSAQAQVMPVNYSTYYDQYYHHHGVDYNSAQIPPSSSPHTQINSNQHQQEYKTVPSTRYHPFINSSSNSHSTNNLNNDQSVQISNNGSSPRVVSSTSPTQTAPSPTSGLMQIPSGQPTPSPSPKQCDKCGVVCETNSQLNEHSTTAHPTVMSNQEINIKNENGESHVYSSFSEAPYIKDEPSSNILDLDSQKMVYPQHSEGTLPPMHSLHHLSQSMQRHHMMWDGHGFMPPHPNNDFKAPYYHHESMKSDYPSAPTIIKNEFIQSNHIKSEYGIPSAVKQDYHIKAEYNIHQNQASSSGPLPLPPSNSKNFQTEISESGNQLTASPSDFPSTTTPQENGSQYRTFEPPTSSLPTTKGSTWKSNEARRPKTYNCTACNKW
jgi:hypothetical protein